MNKTVLSVLLLTIPLWLGVRSADARTLTAHTWQVDGVERTGLIALPEHGGQTPAPVVFVFHGHGGTAAQASRSLAVHTAWPEAMVVYLQGLPTPGRLTDPEGRKTGWQGGPGEQGDRDLRFFDVVWQDLRDRRAVDLARVYACGHSNGGGFTYLLWAKRRSVFAAFGPSGSIAARDYGPLEPAPVFHIAGRQDTLVKFAWQERMTERLRRQHRCGPGEPKAGNVTLYPSAIGAPVATYFYDGGHTYPPEATGHLVAFLRGQIKR